MALSGAPSMAPDLNLNLALSGVVEATTAATAADDLAMRQSVTDLLRTTIVPGAGAELVGRQLAAFSAGDDSRSTLAGGATPGMSGTAGGASSGELMSRLGSTTLPGLQPLGDARAFSSGLADRLLMLGGPGAHSARLKLYPEHLGELKVDIRIEDGAAEVHFATTTPQAREAIENSLPRLRELFAEQGIQLTRTDVDAGSNPMGQPGADQQRRTTGDEHFQREHRWQPAAGARTAAIAGPGRSPAESATSRLLDVWA
jgi:flagellar hook-length control protein FliK